MEQWQPENSPVCIRQCKRRLHVGGVRHHILMADHHPFRTAGRARGYCRNAIVCGNNTGHRQFTVTRWWISPRLKTRSRKSNCSRNDSQCAPMLPRMALIPASTVIAFTPQISSPMAQRIDRNRDHPSIQTGPESYDTLESRPADQQYTRSLLNRCLQKPSQRTCLLVQIAMGDRRSWNQYLYKILLNFLRNDSF